MDNAQRPCSDLYGTQSPSKYHNGSCQWLTEDEKFLSWLGLEPNCDGDGRVGTIRTSLDPRFIWLCGPPGSGKSIASGHIISYLDANGFDVSYFFFKAASHSTVAQLLLSLAYQMAETNPQIRQDLLTIIKGGSIVNYQDYTTIWNIVFLGCVFKTQFLQPQYWVIDALDECPRDSLISLVYMLSRVNQKIPLKIFVSSRPERKVREIFEQENVQYISFQTGREESLQDIGAYLRSRPKLRGDVDGQPLVDLILKKSGGIFLWATLVTDRLDECYSIEDMEAVVKGVPSEMNDFYADIIAKIEESPNADLAKCILKWIVSAPIPLSVDELREAVKLDIKRTLLETGTRTALSQICRNLVTVNGEGKVQLMHQTVRTYLTSEDSNFYISEQQAHEDVALICLAYLNGSDFQPRINRRARPTDPTPTAFDSYAVLHFAYHLGHSHSPSSTTCAALRKFTDTKALIWVERIAETTTLRPIMTVIKNLKQYLVQLIEANNSLDDTWQWLGSWINDLARLVTNFGIGMTDSPPSIYTSIPSLCPRSSFPHKVYTSRARQKVICSSNENWDERVSCIPCQSDVKSVATSATYVAIGLVKGQIRIYDQSTLELIDELYHGGPVRQLAFGNVSGIFVSGSPKLITVWSAERRKLWSSDITGILFSVCFSPDDSMLFASVSGELDRLLMTFGTQDGATLGFMRVEDDTSDSDSDDDFKPHARHIPKMVKVSPLLGLAAVSYRSTHLVLYLTDYKLNRMSRISQFAKEGSEDVARPPQALDVAFCPATEHKLFAVLYQDGDLVTVELDHLDRATQRDVYYIFARALAASPDGRTLAVAENSGAISLFTFDTLRLIHRITYDSIVTGIAFSPNSLRLYDIRGLSCNVWEPPSLLNNDGRGDDSNQTDESRHESKDFGFTLIENQQKLITCMIQAGDDPFMLCGREDGSITIHDTRDSNVVMEMKEHQTSLLHLSWSHKLKILYSVDIASRCIATRFSISRAGDWEKLDQLFNYRVNHGVTQLLAREDEQALLIVTRSVLMVWESGTFTTVSMSLGDAIWMLHPTDMTRLLLMSRDTIHPYYWEGLRRCDETPMISTLSAPDALPSAGPTGQWASRLGIDLLVHASKAESEVKTAFLVIDSSKLQLSPVEASATGTVQELPCQIRTVLGILGSKIFFLTRQGWICSFNLKSSPGGKHYSRYFFIPPFWRTGNDLMISVVSKNHLVLVHRDELVILQRFLDYEEKLPLDQVE